MHPELPDNAQIIGSSQPASVRERFDRIYHTLRDRICLLEYAPSGRLSEEELAKEFSTSRTPIRRVLARLESEGLVESVHGVGTIVTDPDIGELVQIYHLRMELALLVGKLSPIPRSAEDLERIRALIARCDEEMKNPTQKAFLHLNMAFFAEIRAFTGNLPLREISERLYYQVVRVVLKMMPKLGLAEEFSAFRSEMQAVLSAAEIRDWEAIGYIRRAHISMSFHRMMNYADTSELSEERSKA
ncbi:GntR family transcriptional regulator [Sinorhizobium sp. 8-89]|uniref:GntR family transcriptional regulator n=1 Tax=Sinorhizobium sp. 7-81 TaxID=3049087 RepID=UPI0024C3DEEE|nr:GntR family transcriptional regulator [Sinorhizobium sp. 7-81]MDK1386092.1 GntR family transcriptional regulator [Sinorhizobium sp. 7-81]